MKEARILSVVIASPSDVQAERDALQNVIEELNRGIAGERGLRLALSRWETDTYPGFHSEGPQGLIDPILNVGDCDLFIGVFWTRFGTPTPDGTTGTEHEFYSAYNAWKERGRPQILVYFNQRPYNPQSSDEILQWGKVLEFRRNFPKEGLFWKYKGKAQFERMVRNHLTNYIRNASHTSLPAAPVREPIRQLYAPVDDFVGRRQEIERITYTLREKNSDKGKSVVICGMSGIGKTQLAMKVGKEFRHDYPTQLFVAMQGTADKPRDPTDAIKTCIRALTGPEEALPNDIHELQGRYYNLLCGKGVLIALDNVANKEQAHPLLPPPGCALIVTSINRLFLTNETLIVPLDVFQDSDACDLLLGILPHVDKAIVREISDLCGHMPMALRAAGAFMNETRIDPVTYVNQLKQESTRFNRIDPELASVDAAFNVSYKRLSPEAQRVFRKLAVFESSFDAAGEESICEDKDNWHLTILEKRSLILSAILYDNAKRYRLQNLGRLFAKNLLEADEQFITAKRHSEYYYQNVLRFANNLYEKGGESCYQALKLFDREIDNIRAGQTWAKNHCKDDNDAAALCIAYNVAGESLFALRLTPEERLQSLEASLYCAELLGDGRSLCRLAGIKGRAYFELWDFQSAIEQHNFQLTIAREIQGAEEEVARALNGLGDVYLRLGKPHLSRDHYERALAISRDSKDRRGEGRALNNLGENYRSIGEFDKAIEFYYQQLAIARELGDLRSEGYALNNLGDSFSNRGKIRDAIQYHEESLKIAQEIGSKLGRANTLNNLGNAYLALMEPNLAMEFYQQALELSEGIGYSFGKYMSLSNLSEAYIEAGDYQSAIKNLIEAREFFEDKGGPRGLGNVLNNLGKAYIKSGNAPLAFECLNQALIIARQIEASHGEAHVLESMGDAYASIAETSKAIIYYSQAKNYFQKINDKLGEADVLYKMSIELGGSTDRAQSVVLAEEALKLYEQIDQEHPKISLVLDHLAKLQQ